MSMRRFLVLLTVAAMMLAVMMALSGVAQAQGGDVCVSLQGETTVQMGTSTCTSDATSHAVAVNDSEAVAQFGSNAVAVNDSLALGLHECTVTAQNGDIDVCVFF